ncbi:Uncharacterised protein [Serratia proteamaculans]|nr:Uncharacterised protein [Serratia proteamaculans]
MTIKDIAQILNVETQSLNVRSYRRSAGIQRSIDQNQTFWRTQQHRRKVTGTDIINMWKHLEGYNRLRPLLEQ